MTFISKKLFTILLLTGVLFGTLLPYFSALALIGDIADIGECALRNRLKQFLSEVLAEVAKAIKAAVKAAVCAGLSYITGGLVNCPDEVITKGATETVNAKESIEDTVARCISRQALTRMTRGMLEVIREGGRDGGPAYVQNWRDFTIQSQSRGENIWRGLLYVAANGEGDLPPFLCRHIRESEAFNSLRPTEVENLIQSLGPNRRINSLEEYLTATKCNPVVDANYDVFKNDFSAGGGWDMWEKMLQPQNNIYGTLAMALAELDKQRSLEEKAATNEVISGQGFLGIRGENASDSCLAANALGKCVVYKNVKTPGRVISDAATENAFKSELDWIVSSDEINELLIDMFDVVVARLKNLGATDSATPPIEIPDVGGSIEVEPEPGPEPADNGENEGNGNGNGTGSNPNPNYPFPPGVCASDGEIEQFLIDNPGDEGRLSSAFPCS